MGALTIFLALGTFEFGSMHAALNALSPTMRVAVATAASLFLFLGATGKSAQIPLYIWLPDAMAGPTPVSALIHAATMVTAGIYMICRLNFLYVSAPIALAVVAIVGAVTALFAATMGLFQTDIKKVLAYSTVSQLGYMFLGVGTAAFSAGFFHVFTHAFFKACLFLGSGAVIHALHHEQDIRKMGGLWKKLPITCATFVISTLAIMGFPGFSGFFSKDEILWQAYASGFGPYQHVFHGLNYVLFALGWLAAGLTSFYMWRVTFLTFFSGKYRGDQHTWDHAHESPLMSFVLVVLGIFALGAGFLNVPEVLGGEMRLTEFLRPVLGSLPHIEGLGEGIEWLLMGLTLLLALAAFALAYMWFGRGITPAQEKQLETLPGRGMVKVLANKWYVDEIYEAAIVRPIAVFSDFVLYRVVDAFIIDKVMLGIFAVPVKYGGYLVRWMQNGNVQRYATVFVAATIVLLWVVL
jgi:NADH-quinone oxidoreductase subunit L